MTGAIGLAALCCSGAVWVLLGPSPAAVRLDRVLAVQPPRGPFQRVPDAVATWFRAIRDRRRSPDRWRSAVIEVCDGMAAELAAGRTPDEAFAAATAVLDPHVAAPLNEILAGGVRTPGGEVPGDAGSTAAFLDRPRTFVDEPGFSLDRPGALPARSARSPDRRPGPSPGRPGPSPDRPGAFPGSGRASARSGLFVDRAFSDPLEELPERLGELAGRPGAEGLRLLAACWRIGAERGGTLAAVLDGLAAALRDEEAQRQEVAVQLAGPRATARLLAGLPILGLGMAAALGADPLGFLCGTLPGLICLGVGVGLDLTGLWWTRRLAKAAEAPGSRMTHGRLHVAGRPWRAHANHRSTPEIHQGCGHRA